MHIPDTTPIIVGVGEASERVSDGDYARLSPADLAAVACRAALEDAGARAIASAIDLLAVVRQFEISTPRASPPFGASNNIPRSVAQRIGANPRHAVLEPSGGQGPQHLVNELSGRIARGEFGCALICGAEAISTVRHVLSQGEKLDWAEQVEGDIEDRGYGVDGLLTDDLIRHGARTPVQIYALLENARRARLGMSREAYRNEMAALFAPFTEVASRNPHAMSRARLSAEEIAVVTPENRVVADPFPRRVIARDQANQGAAVLLSSVGVARAQGIPSDKWIFLHGRADAAELSPIARPDMGRYPAAGAALRHALETARVTIDDVALFDFYSCFPIAVFSVLEELGIAKDDPRAFTLTGGLPFFGGAGNNYSMHAIAAMARALRAQPQAYGLLGANGGFLSKYSVGLYSARPCAWRDEDDGRVQRTLTERTPAPLAQSAVRGNVETYTVDFDRDPPGGVLVCRTEAGERFVAMTSPDHPEVLAHMTKADPLGAVVVCVLDERGRRIVTALT